MIITDAGVQYGGGCVVQICHTISTKEAHLQFRCRCGVRRRYTINADADLQYGGGTPSLWRGCAEYRTTRTTQEVAFIWKNDLFYQQFHYNLDFILL